MIKRIDEQLGRDNEENRLYLKQGLGPCLTKEGTVDIKLYENFKIRRLTPTECERLQGFPDGWTEGFSDTQRYKMMGNAVTVNVIREIAKKLLNHLTFSREVMTGG